MIVYKQWIKGAGQTRIQKDGWFLLGIIPLYIRWRSRKGQ